MDLLSNSEQLAEAEVHIEEARPDILVAVLAWEAGQETSRSHRRSKLAGGQTGRPVGRVDRRTPAGRVLRTNRLGKERSFVGHGRRKIDHCKWKPGAVE